MGTRPRGPHRAVRAAGRRRRGAQRRQRYPGPVPCARPRPVRARVLSRAAPCCTRRSQPKTTRPPTRSLTRRATPRLRKTRPSGLLRLQRPRGRSRALAPCQPRPHARRSSATWRRSSQGPASRSLRVASGVVSKVVSSCCGVRVGNTARPSGSCSVPSAGGREGEIARTRARRARASCRESRADWCHLQFTW